MGVVVTFYYAFELLLLERTYSVKTRTYDRSI